MGPSDPIIKLADKSGIELHCRQKCDEVEDPLPRLTFAKRSEDLDAALRSTAQVGGGISALKSIGLESSFAFLDVTGTRVPQTIPKHADLPKRN